MNTTGRGQSLDYLKGCFRGYWPRILLTLLALGLARAASTADPVLFKQIIDHLSGQLAGATSPAVGGGLDSTLLTLVLVYFGLRITAMVLEMARDWIFAAAQIGVGRRISERVFEYLLRLPVSYHAEQKTGALARKIARGSRATTFMLDFLVSNILPVLVELVLVSALLLRLYPVQYGAITLATVAAYTWFTIWSTEKRQVFRINANRADDEASGVQVESITHIETVKYFNNEPRALRKFGESVNHWYRLSVRNNQLFAAITAGQNAILLAGLGSILFLGIRATAEARLTVGDLVLLSTYVVRLSTPIGVLGFVYRGIKDGFADLDEMGRIFENPITVAEPRRPVPLPNPKGDVVFDRVCFSYAGRDDVLKEVNLHIPAGSRLAVVGPSGSGKSTLVRLLFRFHDPTSGAIRIDGVDLRDLSSDTRRSLMAVVPQEAVLFNTTLAENLRFARPDATQAELEAACRLANIDAFIEGLPEGYETTVGERGVKLSGGEKQRVAIARALISDPKILVFDEATSSLDSASERVIQDAMAAIAANRTTLVIAHRLSTIVDSDLIVVIREGEIVEQGTHDELIRQDGLYAHLWSLQSREENSDTLDEAEVTSTAAPLGKDLVAVR